MGGRRVGGRRVAVHEAKAALTQRLGHVVAVRLHAVAVDRDDGQRVHMAGEAIVRLHRGQHGRVGRQPGLDVRGGAALRLGAQGGGDDSALDAACTGIRVQLDGVEVVALTGGDDAMRLHAGLHRAGGAEPLAVEREHVVLVGLHVEAEHAAGPAVENHLVGHDFQARTGRRARRGPAVCGRGGRQTERPPAQQ